MKWLTKSDYLKFLIHPAYLWLAKHTPDRLPPVDEATQAIFDQGEEIELTARRLFPGLANSCCRTRCGGRLLLGRLRHFEILFRFEATSRPITEAPPRLRSRRGRIPDARGIADCCQ